MRHPAPFPQRLLRPAPTLRASAATAFCALLAASALAEKDSPGDEGASEGEADLHEVEPAPFTVKVKLPGVVESLRETPVSFDLERWQDLIVAEAPEHGTEVEEGGSLIKLETEKLEEKIEELRVAMPLKELELSQAEAELDKLEKDTPIQLRKVRRAKKRADEDLEHFQEVGRDLRERGVEETIKARANMLAYAEEELRQLERMYRQDDLVEETEEIILQRARNTVDSHRWQWEQARISGQHTLETTLPREHENLVQAVEDASLNQRTGRRALPEALEKKRLEVASKRRELEEARKALAEHEADLAAMVAIAPHGGIVYHGMSQRGNWITAGNVERRLVPGGKLALREVALTLVDPGLLRLRLAVDEDKLKDLAPGQRAEVVLAWNSDLKLPAEVERVSHVPFADNTYDAVLSLDGLEDAAGPVRPGMKAEAEVLLYEREDALAVPRAAVAKEGDRETVTLADGEEREVSTGRRSGDLVEITDGLEPGDRVRIPRGKEDKDKDGKEGEEEKEEKEGKDKEDKEDKAGEDEGPAKAKGKGKGKASGGEGSDSGDSGGGGGDA